MNFCRLISKSRLGRLLYTQVAADSPGSISATPPRNRDRIYSRLSALGATGGSVEKALNQFILEGKPVIKDELIRCLRELRKFQRHEHALEVMDWMERRKMNFSLTDYAFRLDLLAKVKGVKAAEKFFDELSPKAKNRFTYGSLLNCYCHDLLVDKAELHFKQMQELRFVTTSLAYNNLMGMYMRLGKPEKVHLLVEEMKQKDIPPCTYTYAMWMQSCSSLNDIGGVEKVFEEMTNDSEDKCTWNTYANLAAIYVKAGLHEKAVSALKKLEEKMHPRNRHSYHFLISLYAGASNLFEVKRVWKSMKTFLPETNNTSYLTMLQALAKLNDIEGINECFTEWESSFRSYDMRLTNIAIKGYLDHDMYEEAALAFDNAIKKGKGPFSKAREMFIVYLLKKQNVDMALKCLEEAVSDNDNTWTWSQSLVDAFFKYFKEAKDVDGAEEFCATLKKFSQFDSREYCSLIKTYLAAGKSMSDMRKRLENTGVEITEELEHLLEKVCPKIDS